MKRYLRIASQIVAFVVTIVLISTVNAPRSLNGMGNQLTISAATDATPLSSQDSSEEESENDNPNNANSTEEIHKDIDLLDRAIVGPIGFALFIPGEPLHPSDHSISPSHRPPLA